MMWIWENSQKLAELATAFSLLLAALLGALGLWQFLRGIKANRELSAKELFADYEIFAFENPEMANPHLLNINYDDRTIDGERRKFEQYEWFVSYVDTVCEEILFLAKSDDWRSTLISQLRYHSEYFRSKFYEDSGYFNHVSSDVGKLILEINPNLRRLQHG